MSETPSTPLSPLSQMAKQLYPNKEQGGTNDGDTTALYTSRQLAVGNPLYPLYPDASMNLSQGAGPDDSGQSGAQQSPAPTTGLASKVSRIKARNADEGNIIRNYGYGLLAKYYGVPVDQVASDPKRYWDGFAKVADNPLVGESTFNGAHDPLSVSPKLRDLLLLNRDLFVGGGGGQAGHAYGVYRGFSDNLLQGRQHSTVVLFDSPTRPKDNGTLGASYGGKVYVLHSTPDGNINARGPYDASAYANSISNEDNRPATAEISGHGITDGGDDYHNDYGHNDGTSQALRLGRFVPNSEGLYTPGTSFINNVSSTGPNPIHQNEWRVEDGEIHAGWSDLGNHNSRGSKACFTVNPGQAHAFFGPNFVWRPDRPNTGTSTGRVYTYKDDTPESVEMRDFIERLHPTR